MDFGLKFAKWHLNISLTKKNELNSVWTVVLFNALCNNANKIWTSSNISQLLIEKVSTFSLFIAMLC